MKSACIRRKILLGATLGIVAWGCSNSNGGGAGSGGNTTQPATPDGPVSIGSGGVVNTSGGASTPLPEGGSLSNGGVPGSGAVATSGTGVSGSGASRAGANGSGTSGSGASRAGASGSGTSRAGASGSGDGVTDGGVTTPDGNCTIGTWPTADPSKAGPYVTVTENDVGPEAGTPPDGGTAPRFTLFRPKDLAQVDLCHPVITWGNGTGATPNMYGTLLKNFASHGFVVIASNNTNVARGTPAPMIAGVTWVLEQNEDPSSVLYHRIDTTHIGATGHSQGAMATTQASGDSRITASVPIEGASAQRNLHGPAMFFCGGQDDIVGCDGAKSALAAVTTLPAMYAELTTVDHGSWMSRGSTLSAADTAFTAWMRVHLMGDTELKSWFYGDSCKLCTDSAWIIDRKNMDL